MNKFTLVLVLLGLSLVGCADNTVNGFTPREDVQVVGFDIDDTILFSTPAFEAGKVNGFNWSVINTSDHLSVPLRVGCDLVKFHLSMGHEVHLVTARTPTEGETLTSTVSALLGIPMENVHFAPNGKTEILRDLKVEVFYGDSDSDITDAMEAGVEPVRVPRHPDSSYRDKEGHPKKYHPGTYGEKVIPVRGGWFD